MRVRVMSKAICFIALLFFGNALFGQGLFTIGQGKTKKTFTFEDVKKQQKSQAFEIEKKRFQLIDGVAKQAYIAHFWETEAKKSGKTISQTKREYIEKNTKVTKAEVDAKLIQFKDMPQLKQFNDAEKRKQVEQWMKQLAERDIVSKIFQKAVSSKDFVMLIKPPVEPNYVVPTLATDKMRYGPAGSDNKPISCKGDDCVTIIEFSEPECPYCRRVAPTIKKLLATYKGKIRWILRDFPLSFHKRAKPAMIAAHCADDKYWHFVTDFFETGKLAEADISKMVKTHKIDLKKFETCRKDPKIAGLVDSNMQSGVSVGVTGTPTFFVDGKRMGGAVPLGQFTAAIEAALATKKKKG